MGLDSRGLTRIRSVEPRVMEHCRGANRHERCVMAHFRFRAVNSKSGGAVKVEVFLGGTSRGYTPDRKDSWLEVETSMSGKFSWYAKRGGTKIGSGESTGGSITIYYDPS